LLNRSRNFLINNVLDLYGIYLNAFGRNNKAEILNLYNVKLALSNVDLESSFKQLLYYFNDVLFMIFYSLRVDEDVVKVNSVELVEVFLEDVVNLSLKRSGCVA